MAEQETIEYYDNPLEQIVLGKNEDSKQQYTETECRQIALAMSYFYNPKMSTDEKKKEFTPEDIVNQLAQMVKDNPDDEGVKARAHALLSEHVKHNVEAYNKLMSYALADQNQQTLDSLMIMKKAISEGDQEAAKLDKSRKELEEKTKNSENTYDFERFISQDLASKSVSSKTMDDMAQKVADDLKLIVLTELSKVNPVECLGKNWDRESYKSTSLVNLINRSNQILHSVMGDIMSASSSSHQEKIYNFYAKVLQKTLMDGNYFVAQSIFLALNNTAVTRLKLGDATSESVLYAAQRVFNPSDNFASLRKLQSNTSNSIFTIPKLLGDFTFIEDGNPAMIKRGENEYQSIYKSNLMGASISQITQLQNNLTESPPQQTGMNTTVNSKLDKIDIMQKSNIEKQTLLNDKEKKAFDTSLRLMPRGTPKPIESEFKKNPQQTENKIGDFQSQDVIQEPAEKSGPVEERAEKRAKDPELTQASEPKASLPISSSDKQNKVSTPKNEDKKRSILRRGLQKAFSVAEKTRKHTEKTLRRPRASTVSSISPEKNKEGLLFNFKSSVTSTVKEMKEMKEVKSQEHQHPRIK